MNWFTGVTGYFLLWWVTLFAVLPLGTRPVAEADSSSGWRGAPERPQLLRKALITTVVAAIAWVVIYLIVTSSLFDFRNGWLAMPKD